MKGHYYIAEFRKYRFVIRKFASASFDPQTRSFAPEPHVGHCPQDPAIASRSALAMFLQLHCLPKTILFICSGRGKILATLLLVKMHIPYLIFTMTCLCFLLSCVVLCNFE